MTDTLDSIHQAFAAYRRQHRKGAYPRALRRRAMLELKLTERLQLAARLGLTAEQVARWERTVEGGCQHQEFFEVPLGVGGPAAGFEQRVEVELPGGAVLRVHGEVNTAMLRMVVAAVRAEAVAS
jgi:hypothetical protein